MKEREKQLSYLEVKARYDYNSETGAIFSHISNKIVGTNSNGYLTLNIKQKRYHIQRVAWLLYFGHWPDGEVDHRDGNTSNNIITNLRLVTHAQNCKNRKLNKNNKSGIKGVNWHDKTQTWRAYISVNDKWLLVGHFKEKEAAIEARKSAEEKYHGEFRRAA